MNALLLSAGLGTRLRPYTNQLPKPCIPFFGLPLAYYSLYLLEQASCFDITANLHHLPEAIKTMFSEFPHKQFQFQYSLEKDQPMGSGGALYYAQQFLKSSNSFFAINADEVFIPSRPDILKEVQNHHERTSSLLTLLVTDHPELGKTLKPIWIDDQGGVIAFGEKPSRSGVRPVHYTGCKIFSNEVLPLIPSGESHIFHDTVVPAIKKGAVVNTVHDTCQWWETGNFQSFLQATSDAISIIEKSPQKNFFRDVYNQLGIPFDFTCKSTGSLKLAYHNSNVLGNVSMSGTLFLGAGVSLAKNISLNNCVINAGASVQQSVDGKMIL